MAAAQVPSAAARDSASTGRARVVAGEGELMRLPVPGLRYIAAMIAWNRARPQRTAIAAASY
jgi:hypothetical protein